ncbi:MAG: GntR family transcriptional regulator [Pseudomonadota bacterium]
MPKLKPIETATLQERAYASLRIALMSGVYAPGDSITLRGVAQDLGTSQMPVREAVKRLVSERALEMPNSRLVRVPVATQERLKEICNVRIKLESYAAELAAESISEEDLKRIEKLNQKVKTQNARGNVKGVLARNRELHAAIYRIGGNRLLCGLIEDLWVLVGPYFNLASNGKQNKSYPFDLEKHEELLLALSNGDGTKASAIIQADIQQTFEMYSEFVAEMVTPGDVVTATS